MQPSPPHEPPQPRRSRFTAQFARAMELPFTLVGATILGGAAGYFLDRWLSTAPWLMLLLGGLGFYAGVREVSRLLLRPADKGKTKND